MWERKGESWAVGKSAITSHETQFFLSFGNEFRNWVSLEYLDSHQSMQPKLQIQAGTKKKLGLAGPFMSGQVRLDPSLYLDRNEI